MNVRNNILRLSLISFFVLVLTAAMGGSGGGGGGGGGEDEMSSGTSASLYQKGVAADKSGDFKTALKYFQQAVEKDSNNPDVLNMLAHSQRKLGMIDEALDNYKKALRIRPKFADAREYLGEAYIQAALREIDTLKGYGKDGDEQREDLIKALKEAAANVK